MTRNHKIRIACAGLIGQQREDTMLALLKNPDGLNKALGVRMKYPHRSGARTPRKRGQRKDVNITIRLTYPEYVGIRQRAQRVGGITRLVRLGLNLL